MKLFRADAPAGGAAREMAVQARVLGLGAPAPGLHGLVGIDGREGFAMDRVPGPVLAEVLAEDQEAGLARMLRLHRAIHALPGAGLPSLRERLRRGLAEAPLTAARRAALMAMLGALPEGDRLCHGDFHPFNIMGPPGAEVAIDWVDAACGAPLADACHSVVLIAPHASAVARRYLALYGGDPAEAAAWLAIAAAARLAEGLPGERAALLPWAEGPP